MMQTLWRDIDERLPELTAGPSSESLALRDLLFARVESVRGRMEGTVRRKRGIFDFVGRIGSALLGTAMTSDVQAIARANEQLVEWVEGVIIDRRKVNAKVNVIGRRQEQVVKTVNGIIEEQNKIVAEVQWLLNLYNTSRL